MSCLVLMPVEDAEAGLLAGLKHIVQSCCDQISRGFVNDERRFPEERFCGGFDAQTESASCYEGQKDSADDKSEWPAGNAVVAGCVLEKGQKQNVSEEEASGD